MQVSLQELWINDFAGSLAREIASGNESGARKGIVALVGYSAESTAVLEAEANLLVRLPRILGCSRDAATEAITPLRRAAIAAIPWRRVSD